MKLYCCDEYIKQFEMTVGNVILFNHVFLHEKKILVPTKTYIYGSYLYQSGIQEMKGTNSLFKVSARKLTITTNFRASICTSLLKDYYYLFVPSTILNFYYIFPEHVIQYL